MIQRVITDSILGTLVWNENLQALDGKIHLLLDHEIELSIKVKDSDIVDNNDIGIPTLLAQARFQIARVVQREKDFRLTIADQVLQYYCEEFHLRPVDRSEIAENIGLYLIDLFPEENINLYYHVNQELEWWKEHDITLILDEQGEVDEVFWL